MTSAYLLGDLRRDEGLRLTAYPDPRSALAQACADHEIDGRPAPIAVADFGYRALPGWETFDGAPWTIGYGHTGPEVHEGLCWTQAQAEVALAADFTRTARTLDAEMAWWRKLGDLRQDVIANMAFNLGVGRLESFDTFLGFVQAGQFAAAALDLRGTAWAREVGERGSRLIRQMQTGVHQA